MTPTQEYLQYLRKRERWVRLGCGAGLACLVALLGWKIGFVLLVDLAVDIMILL